MKRFYTLLIITDHTNHLDGCLGARKSIEIMCRVINTP